MFEFPSSFPAPTQSFTVRVSTQSIRTKMEAGVTRQRRRTTVDISQVSVQWELSDLEFTIFSAIHTHELRLGSEWFTITLPLGGELRSHTARLLNGEFTHSYVPHKHWRVNAILEIQERYVMPQNVLDFYLDVGFSDSAITNLLSAFASFHDVVHVTQPTSLAA